MMKDIPKTTRCPDCGWEIFRARVGVLLDANLTPFVEDEWFPDEMYDVDGKRIKGVARMRLPLDDEPDGYGHRPHALTCPKRRER